MELSSLTQTAFLSATISALVFAITCAYQSQKGNIHWSFPIAALVQVFWLAGITWYGSTPFINIHSWQISEALHIISWIVALLLATQSYCNQPLPRTYVLMISGITVTCLALFLATIIFKVPQEYIEGIICWQGIGLAIFGLLSVEQLYRNVSNIRLIKLLCINLAIVFIFDAWLFSQSILSNGIAENMWQARAAVVMATSVLMAIGTIALAQSPMEPAKITVSRPIAFYTTSLVIVGFLFTVLAISGYYIQLYGGSWGTVAYTILVVCALLFVISLFSSRTLREKINVQINKHLFSHKYDYRAEWLRLIDKLSEPTSMTDSHERAITTLADLFKCSGGALWLKRGKILVPTKQVNTDLNIAECIESADSPFCLAMEKEDWVFYLDGMTGALSYHNELLPDWAKINEQFWLILPLLNDNNLTGFIVLNRPKDDSVLNWEDLDLIKTVGRQIASYLQLREKSEELTEARQFDAFNKLSAYVMHDLKNLIAQQSLVVKNAEKHKDNPAFIEDAIHTINNSVNRMNNLLRKLQHNEPLEAKTLTLKNVLVTAVTQCQRALPAPTLRGVNEDIRVKADPDSLIMVFTHLITNAQDATPADGFVDISASVTGNNVVIYIEDNGEGMTADFIQEKLFKPFETTKSGKGMGIGVFQAREYAQSLGGNVQVQSTPGEGTSFIVSLPLVQIHAREVLEQ